jgi:hypothetical protein
MIVVQRTQRPFNKKFLQGAQGGGSWQPRPIKVGSFKF